MFIISYLISLRKQPSNSKKWKASLPLILRSPLQGPDVQTQLCTWRGPWATRDPWCSHTTTGLLTPHPSLLAYVFLTEKKMVTDFYAAAKAETVLRHFMLVSSTGSRAHGEWAAAVHSWSSFCTGGSSPPASSTPSLKALWSSLGETKPPSSYYS